MSVLDQCKEITVRTGVGTSEIREGDREVGLILKKEDDEGRDLLKIEFSSDLSTEDKTLLLGLGLFLFYYYFHRGIF